MTRQRPGVQHTNKARDLLNNIDFIATPVETDIEAAKAYSLVGLAEALGAIAVALTESRSTTTAAPTAETGARP